MNIAVPKQVKILSLLGGLIQVATLVAILFLPVLSTYHVDEPQWRWESYLQRGGTPLWPVGFAVIVLLGGLAIVSTQRNDVRQARLLLWFAAIASNITSLLVVYGVGFVFCPGSILLLLAAVLCRSPLVA